MAMTPADLRGSRVLVTGGTGFIGGRLVAQLHTECGATVRVLVRDLRRAVQIARYPVEIAQGNLLVEEDVVRAVEGCDVVFHCAMGNQGPDRERGHVNVAGTTHLINAMRRANVRRVVHVSSMVVYGGGTAGADLTEASGLKRTGVTYADSKLESEEMVKRAAASGDLDAVVCQPTIVYGPFGHTFTTTIVQRLKTGRQILVNGGDGICNAVYVDDVVSALLLAAVATGVSGESFLISGPQPVTWREFFERYQQCLGLSDRLVSMSEEEAIHYSTASPRRRWLLEELLRELRNNDAFRERAVTTTDGRALAHVVRRSVPLRVRSLLKRSRPKTEGTGTPAALPIHRVPTSRIRLMASHTVVRTDKAQRMLGYSPRYTFEEGMRLTGQWLRWAGL